MNIKIFSNISNNRSVSVGLIQSLLAASKFHNVDLEKVISNTNLKLDNLFPSSESTDTTNRIELSQVGPLLRSLWHEMEDEASGFLSQPLKLGVFSMMCHAIISAGNLRRALLRSNKFIALLSDDLTLELNEVGDEAQLKIHYENPHNLDQVFFITSLFVIWIRLSCWLIERPIILERIEFQYDAPDYDEDFSLMFPCRHSFSQAENIVVFNKSFLSLPIVQDNQTLSIFLHNAPESLLTQFSSDESLSAQVKRLMLHRNGIETELENLSFELVSQELCMTTHTLRRHLKDEGNTFQQIKDSIRRDQALILLEDKHLAILDISLKLGFSEPAAFNRAFKKWTGLTPGAYRGRKSSS